MPDAVSELPPAAPAQAACTAIMDRARHELSEASYKLWFADLAPGEGTGFSVELVAPTSYVKNWLAGHYMELINTSIREVLGPGARIRLRARRSADAAPPGGAPQGQGPRAHSKGARKSAPGHRGGAQDQATLDQALGEGSPFPARFTFDDFVSGPSNKFAHAAALAVAEAPPSKAYNPLFIYGGVGLGKTHLLLAIANHVWALSPRTGVRYVTSESFMTEFIKSVRERRGYQFQRQYRDVDVLLLDDVQFLARAEETQTEFFHTFNHLHQHERQNVIASKFDNNIRELEGALLRVAAFASLSRQATDLPLAERALEDLIPERGQEIPPALILEQTAKYFGLGPGDLISKSRSRPLTTARHVAMYLLRELTGLSLIKIGELFERDHTTVMHGIKKIEGLMPARGSTYKQVQELTKKIRASSRGGS